MNIAPTSVRTTHSSNAHLPTVRKLTRTVPVRLKERNKRRPLYVRLCPQIYEDRHSLPNGTKQHAACYTLEVWVELYISPRYQVRFSLQPFHLPTHLLNAQETHTISTTRQNTEKRRPSIDPERKRNAFAAFETSLWKPKTQRKSIIDANSTHQGGTHPTHCKEQIGTHAGL